MWESSRDPPEEARAGTEVGRGRGQAAVKSDDRHVYPTGAAMALSELDQEGQTCVPHVVQPLERV